MTLSSGRPMANGHATNVMNCMREFKDTFDTASFKSANLRDRPDSKKMHVTPNFPMNNSGLSIPPFCPSLGKARANETATIIPSKKKFLDAKFFTLAKLKLPSPPPPPLGGEDTASLLSLVDDESFNVECCSK
mmetsp:Transcript_35037/g.51219  ORF Transcript_35037/g.51219 Transcript_35037/m.51219 type:complete len:133 (+) Transcript_35037:765-1163(+)